MKCQNVICERTLVGPVAVKATGVHIPHLADVNAAYWKHNWKDHELEGVGYVCPSCGNTRIVKSVVADDPS